MQSVNNDIMWTEKYRPKTLAEYYIEKNQLDKVKEWLDDLKDDSNMDPKPFLVLYGSAGVGKTTLAHLILQKHGYEIIECNASDTRSKKQIRDMIGGISGVSISIDNKNRFKKTAIIMDEIDGLNSITESSGIQELIDIIVSRPINNKNKGNQRRSPNAREIEKEKIKWVCPVICTSNSVKERKIQSLLKYGVFLQLQKPTDNDLNKLISRITKQEHFQINNSARIDIITRASGDYRQVIHLCYANYLLLTDTARAISNIPLKPIINKRREISIYQQEDEDNQALIRTINDVGDTPLDKINYFITHKTHLDIIRYFCSGDSNLYFMNFYNNIIPILSCIQAKLKEAKNKNTFLKAYKTLAIIYNSIRNADLMNYSIFIEKNWELIDYFDIFSVAIPAYIIYQANTTTIREFRLSHHTQYNFMRQEQLGNKKLLNNDFCGTFHNDVFSMYYNLKRFQNDNFNLTHAKHNRSKSKYDNPELDKYIISKSYCKIIDKINELLS